MDVESVSGIPVGGYAWRPHCGGHAFVVIAKATFELVPGEARLAPTQDGLNETDNHWDDDRSRSVYAPSDMAPFKERADVTAVGNAYATNPQGSRTAVVRLATAGIDKKVAVFCDRHIDDKGRVVQGKPFKRMALRYERAAGGVSDNPVGIAPATKANRGDGQRALPNLQTAGGGRRPAGFGPIASSWPLRRRLLRSVAKRFTDARWRELPLPAGLDSTYFNDAPVDQRVDRLRSNERILLENFHPQHRRLATRLPGIEPRAFVDLDGAIAEVALSADSLWIDMTRGVCTVTWRGSFEIASATAEGRVFVALQQPGETLSPDHIPELQSARALRTSSVRLSEHKREIAALASNDAAVSDACIDSAPFLDAAYVELEPSFTGDSLPPPDVQQLRPRLQTVDLAAGAEGYFVSDSAAPLPFVEPTPTETLVAHAPVEPLPFTPVASSASVAVAPPAPASIAPPSAAAFGPWAGRLSSQRHETKLPPTDPNNVTPPPLMLVPPPSSPPRPAAPSGADLVNALPKSHRIELLGSESSELARVQQRWGAVEEERSEDKLDRQLREAFGHTEPLAPQEAQRHLCRTMSHHAASDLQQMREAMMDAVDEDGMFDAPLTLAHGTLRFAFDAVETLRATMASIAPYLKDNDALREEVESARAIIAQQSLAPDAAEEITERIRATFLNSDGLDIAIVDARIERMLLEGRAYQKKKVLGADYVRALLTVGGEQMPCYLTPKLADQTPLYSELVVRVIAELHPRQDQHEQSTRALRVIALGRVVARQQEC